MGDGVATSDGETQHKDKAGDMRTSSNQLDEEKIVKNHWVKLQFGSSERVSIRLFLTYKNGNLISSNLIAAAFK